MTAYLQTQFDEDIVMELSRQWKKECESHESNTKYDFRKKEEWYIENVIEEFCRNSRRNFKNN